MEKASKLKLRRAELMAQLFLQDLGASVWSTGERGPFDFIAVFRTADHKLRIVAIEVKASEHVSGTKFRFQASREQAHAVRHSNVPLLVLVADVKSNKLYYGWAADIRTQESGAKPRSVVQSVLSIHPADEEKEGLLHTILSQPDFSQPAAAG